MILYSSEKTAIRNCIGHICVAVFLAFFGAVYEHFSFGVYSYFMIYAFAIPLLLGALPYGIASLKNVIFKRTFINLWNSSIATFSVGSIIRGVLDIYGTTNHLIIIYPIVGVILGFAAAFVLLRR